MTYWAEPTVNPAVAGSSPVEPAIKSRHALHVAIGTLVGKRLEGRVGSPLSEPARELAAEGILGQGEHMRQDFRTASLRVIVPIHRLSPRAIGGAGNRAVAP